MKMKKINSFFLALLLIVAVDASQVSAATPGLVNLGTANNYVILSKSGVSTVPTSAIIGDIGVSPIDATAITGFGLVADATNVFATSPQVTGKIYAANYSNPTASNLTTAISDMQTAYTDAAGRAASVTELGAGNIGGMTLTSGVYKWGTGVTIPTNLILSGSANDVWIFQIAQNLDLASARSITLSGGAKAANVFWQVAGQVNIGTASHFEGIILSQTAIHMKTGSSINGRLLAQTAVTLESSTVTNPGNSSSTPSEYVPPVPPVNVPPVNVTTTNSTNNSSATTPSSNNTSTNSVFCSQGQLYNIVTGQICTNFIAAVYCPTGNVFSITDGQRCTNFITQNNPQSFNFGTRLVVLGTTGTECRAWQMFFNAKVGAQLSVDSICGPLTMAVARSWQRSSGLEADGFLGSLSRAKAIIQL